MAQVIGTDEFSDKIASGVTLIDFYADWCGPCQAIAPIIDELATEMEGKAGVYKVDVDASGDLAAQFGVMSIPTLLVFKDGEMVEKSVGGTDKSALEDLIKAHI